MLEREFKKGVCTWTRWGGQEVLVVCHFVCTFKGMSCIIHGFGTLGFCVLFCGINWPLTPCVMECCELERRTQRSRKIIIHVVDLVTSWCASSVEPPERARKSPRATNSSRCVGGQARNCLHLSADTTPLGHAGPCEDRHALFGNSHSSC